MTTDRVDPGGERARLPWRLYVAAALARVGNALDVAATRLAERALGDAACGTADGEVLAWVDCPTCDGKGYHHGFGEDGCDPDWCTQCGGPGQIAVSVTSEEYSHASP